MTTKPIDGGPAFPNESGDDRDNNGMALRDYIAVKAMASFILCPLPSERTAEKFNGFSVSEYISTKAYEMADEMLKAREI